ncbi:MAG: hypothetical protein HY858_12935 [Candidatus Solibacter usitatus]|nr:hypothetical protein [Candidatus Solibacter usitatus]
MPRSFSPGRIAAALKAQTRDPQHAVRLVLGLLLAANLIAAWFAFRTPGGSLQDLESGLIAKRKEVLARQQSLERVKKLAALSGLARQAGDSFLDDYFLPRRHAYSMLEVDLANAAKAANIRAKDRTYGFEPIEGSDTLGMLNINANFEGTYADLISLVNSIDRSKRLIIIEQLQAQPQQGANTLAISVKLNAFFRLDGADAAADEPVVATATGDPPAAPASPAPAPPSNPPASTSAGDRAASGSERVSPPALEPRSGPYPFPPKSRAFRKPAPRAGEEQ